MSHERFLTLAWTEAERGYQLGDGLPFGAVIVKDDHVMVSAHNESTKRGDSTAHSELLAIRNGRSLLGPNLRGCILYSTCKPCDVCLQACLISEVDAIVYEDSTVSPKMDSVKKYKRLNLRRTSTGEEAEKHAWKKSFLRQMDKDEQDMHVIASRTKRNLSGGSTGSA